MRNSVVSLNTILRKEIIRIVRIWPQTLLPSPVTMSLYLLVFGEALGSRIGAFGTVPYIDFIVPGLILMAVITNSYSNVVTSFFSSKFHRSVEELMVSPTPNAVIIFGYVMGGMTRGLATGSLVTLVSMFFTRLNVHDVACIAFFSLLTSFVFSLAGMTNGILARKFDDVSIIPTFVIAPLTFLGGVFYSIRDLPQFWQSVSVANPILHMVNGFRYGFLGEAVSDTSVTLGAAVLIVCAVVLFTLNLYLLKKGTGLRS